MGIIHRLNINLLLASHAMVAMGTDSTDVIMEQTLAVCMNCFPNPKQRQLNNESLQDHLRNEDCTQWAIWHTITHIGGMATNG